jgi:hypothetical protein
MNAFLRFADGYDDAIAYRAQSSNDADYIRGYVMGCADRG